MISVSIVGGSGCVGGELLRLLLRHPAVSIQQVTSERLAGKPVTGPHPHLRGVTDLVFTSKTMLTNYDVLILALPHGSAAAPIDDTRLNRTAQPQDDCLHPLLYVESHHTA